jgi:sugar/nucleoside kinase (ribokinase family)
VVAIVGDDFNFDDIEFLKSRNVNLDGLEVADGQTFHWEGLYHENMNMRDTISTDLGVFEGFDPKLPESAINAEFLLLANIDPALQLKVLDQIKSPRLIAFDTMNFWIEGRRAEVEEMISKVDLVILNDEEIFQLTNVYSPLAGAKMLLEMGPKFIVIKKGEHGSMLVTEDSAPFICPAYPVESPKDPTGAGDTFAGAMVGYLAATNDISPYSLRRAMVYGSVAASFTVEEFGLDRLKDIGMNDLDSRFRDLQGMCEF